MHEQDKYIVMEKTNKVQPTQHHSFFRNLPLQLNIRLVK